MIEKMPRPQTTLDRIFGFGTFRRPVTSYTMIVRSRQIILVAEDQIFVRGAAVDVLEDHGYEVMDVGCADDALAILAERDRDIRVLFTDISMPGSINGLVLAHNVRRNWPWIGLLVTSGNPRPPASELPEGSRFLAKAYDTAHMVMHVGELT
jgi:two-component system, response regulator PdtaR